MIVFGNTHGTHTKTDFPGWMCASTGKRLACAHAWPRLTVIVTSPTAGLASYVPPVWLSHARWLGQRFHGSLTVSNAPWLTLLLSSGV
jgi:hypothetical protein